MVTGYGFNYPEYSTYYNYENLLLLFVGIHWVWFQDYKLS